MPSYIQAQDSKKTTSSKSIDLSHDLSSDFSNPSKPLQAKYIGHCLYETGLQIQAEVQLRQKHVVILGFEHPLTITLGKRSESESDLLKPRSWYDQAGIPVVNVKRGGHATLHNQGQLVIYPILRLCDWGLSVPGWVELCQATVACVLEKLGIVVQRKAQPGLFTETGKIAFFGMQISKGISTHGVSINISNRLEDFQLIRSCGEIAEKFDRVTDRPSLPNSSPEFAAGVQTSLEQIFEQFVEELSYRLLASPSKSPETISPFSSLDGARNRNTSFLPSSRISNEL